MVGKVWSEKELSILQDNPILEKEEYYKKGIEECRSWLQIRRKLRGFGKKLNKRWLKCDDELLLENRNIKYVMDELGRSRDAVLQRAVKLGVGWSHFDKYGTNRKWSKEEDAVVRELYTQDSENITSIAERLKRSHKAVVDRALLLGVTRKRVDMKYLFK